MPPLARRLAALRRTLARHRLDALLVSDSANVRYLTGFSGSAGHALVGPHALDLILDARYYEQAASEAPKATRVLVSGAHYEQAIAEVLAVRGARRVAFEADVTSYASYLALTGAAPAVEWVPSRDLVEVGRMVKDAGEIAAMRQAAAITSAAVAEVLASARPGQSERQLADALEAALHRLGGERLAFDPLVVAGPRGAWPHARPSERVMAEGDWLLIDAGTTVAGYCADMTRSVYLGRLAPAARAPWEAVHAALQAGISAVRPGAPACSIDARVREVLAARGFPVGRPRQRPVGGAGAPARAEGFSSSDLPAGFLPADVPVGFTASDFPVGFTDSDFPVGFTDSDFPVGFTDSDFPVGFTDSDFPVGFTHDAGHGVGLSLHERPRLAADDDEPLEAGMVITVEPGLYRPGWGGIRLEELVLVTPTGAEVLTTAPLSPTPLSSLKETW